MPNLRKHFLGMIACSVLVMVALLFAAKALAGGMPSIPAGFVQEHSDFVSWLFGLALFGLLGMLGFFIKTMHENNKAQWKKMGLIDEETGKIRIELSNLNGRINRIEGVCEVRHGGRRFYDPPERPEP